MDLKLFPLPRIDQKSVEQIISILSDSDMDSIIGDILLDKIVYHLYNLTYDEILIIDPETLITREEYEANN